MPLVPVCLSEDMEFLVSQVTRLIHNSTGGDRLGALHQMRLFLPYTLLDPKVLILLIGDTPRSDTLSANPFMTHASFDYILLVKTR